MSAKPGTKDQGLAFRIISSDTVKACTEILKLANDRVMRNYRGPLTSIPKLSALLDGTKRALSNGH